MNMTEKYDVIINGMINFDINVANVQEDVFSRKVSFVKESIISVGGDAQNCALTLGRSGYKTAICGRVGNDYAGEICIRQLIKSGVDTNFLKVVEGNTGIAINIVQNAEAFVLYNKGVNAEFCLEDIDSSLFERTYVMSLNSLFCCGKVGTEFFQKAKNSGTITVADTNTLMPGDSIYDVIECFPYIDYFLPSYDEASKMTLKTDVDEIADVFLKHGVKNVIIKLGEKGCFVKNEKHKFMVEGYRVKAIDTTGAGDNFVAGFIMGLCRNMDLETCAKIANAAGALTVQQLGSNGAVTGLDQLLDFIGLKGIEECKRI